MPTETGPSRRIGRMAYRTAAALLPYLAAYHGARTVTVDGPMTVGNLTFDNANSYTIAGPGPLTFDDAGTPSISVLNGSHTISSPMAIAANNTVEKAGPGTLTISGRRPTARRRLGP